MEFIELTEKEFDDVSSKFELESFYQSSSWGKIKKEVGWDYFFVGVKVKDEVVACSLILGKKVILEKYLFYAPRGVLLDYSNKKLLEYFITNIKEYLKNKNGIMFKMDPLIIYKNHDKDGNVIGDFCNQEIIEDLKTLGFSHLGFSSGYSKDIQFRWTYCLNIEKDEEELIKDMDQRCRRCIRKSEKYPLETVDVDDNNISEFKKIMEHTAARQDHFDRNLEYYKNLKKYLNDRIKMVLVYLDRDKFLEGFKEDKLYNQVKTEKKKKIPVSAGVFIFDKSRANYVYGGTYRKYMPIMSAYKMQLDMIRYTKEKKISIYDFGGISGDFDPKSSGYGVYEFKRGFNGYVVEYIGEFDLVLNKTWYRIYDISFSAYGSIKTFLSKFQKK